MGHLKHLDKLIIMTDDIYLIRQFFPNYPKQGVFEYYQHHYEKMVICVENSLFSSAYYHLHILYMVFTYIQLYRIANERSNDLNLCWTGFPSEEKDYLTRADSPFAFSRISEKTIFRFFRIVNFDDQLVRDLASLITKRNKRMHANGEIFLKTKEDFEKEFLFYLSKMKNIVINQKQFIGSIYDKLASDYDDDYEITEDELNTNFVTQYFFSNYELEYFAKGKHDKVSIFIRDNQ